MTLPDKDRLEKLLGMLGSAFDGERANAASLIQKMADKHKMTINEMVTKVMSGGTAPPPPPHQPQQAWSNVNAAPKRHGQQGGLLGNDLLCGLEAALDTEALTDWERQFAIDVAGRYDRDYELSPKQITVIERIILKAARWRPL
jgi:hypothetical protein